MSEAEKELADYVTRQFAGDPVMGQVTSGPDGHEFTRLLERFIRQIVYGRPEDHPAPPSELDCTPMRKGKKDKNS